MIINNKIIIKLKNKIKIDEIISDFFFLEKRGNNLWACCPFHKEKTPSFCVNPIKGFYRCFGFSIFLIF